MSSQAPRPGTAGFAAAADATAARPVSRWRIIEHGLWFGLLTGLLEGAIVNALRGTPGLAIRCSEAILWQAPLYNTLIFTGVALLLWIVQRGAGAGARRDFVRLAAINVLAAMLLFNLLLIWGKMYQWAAILLALGAGAQLARWLDGRDPAFRALQWRTFGLMLATATIVGVSASNSAYFRERQAWGELPKPLPGAPNVLVITLDTLRADHMSAYGYARQTTPNLDRFAQQGTLFEAAFTNSSWTLPSHASLLTGASLARHGADWLDPMRTGFASLPEHLATHGYSTAAFAANREYVAPEWGLGRGFARFSTYGGAAADDLYRTVYGRKLCKTLLPRAGYFDIPGRKRAPQVNAEFTAWLRSLEGRPFFALLNYFDAHDPYIVPPGHVRRFDGDTPLGDVINFQTQGRQFRRKAKPTATDIQAEINGYDECIAYLDQHVGVLFAELERLGLLNETLVIVTSDHGEAFGNHNLFGHGNSLYIETLRVPLIVRWPGHVPAGLRVGAAVGQERIPVTILDLLGYERHALPGDSLVPLWATSDGAANGRGLESAILSEATHAARGKPGYPTAAGNLRSLITDKWHLIESDAGMTQLFAWRDDPLEQNDLAQTEAGRAALEALRAELARRPAGKAQRVSAGPECLLHERLGLATHGH